jgi:dTMP kinase
MLKNFITLEGGEGTGKSTQIRRLAERLRADGWTVTTTREPGGSPLAERIRGFLLSPTRPELAAADEALLFAAARADHLHRLIVPAIAAGGVVLCDRFADSTAAYQGVKGDSDLLASLYRDSVGDDGPQLTLILDLDPEIGLRRAAARRGNDSADPFERAELAFHVALRARYLAIAAAEPGRCRVIDASGSLETVADLIHVAVAAALKR